MAAGEPLQRITVWLDETLGLKDFPDDSSANGLQFEGRANVRKIAIAVDACRYSIEKAAEIGADMLFVHHGLIWGGLKSITGAMKEKIALLAKNDISLYACHLPLDAHAELGNNAEILKALGAEISEPFGAYHGKKIGFRGVLPSVMPVADFAALVKSVSGGGDVSVVSFGGDVKNIAAVSGGGASCFGDVERSDIDTFITGEPSHVAYLQAEEFRKNIVFAGHYATETFGVRAVGRRISEHFGIETVFVEHPTGM